MLMAAARCSASRLRSDAGGRTAAISSNGSSRRSISTSCNAARVAGAADGWLRRTARSASTRSKSQETSAGRSLIQVRRAVVWSSSITTLTNADVSMYQTSPFISTHLPENLAGRRPPRCRRYWRRRVSEVTTRRARPPSSAQGPEAFDGFGRHEPCHGTTAVGHFKGLPRLDPAQPGAGVLAQLTDADLLQRPSVRHLARFAHVLHGSIWVHAPLGSAEGAAGLLYVAELRHVAVVLREARGERVPAGLGVADDIEGAVGLRRVGGGLDGGATRPGDGRRRQPIAGVGVPRRVVLNVCGQHPVADLAE